MNRMHLEGLKVSKRAERLYREMERTAEQGYKDIGHWDWTKDSYWEEGETVKLMNDIIKIAEYKMKEAKRFLKHDIIDQEEYEYRVAVNKQIIKFAEARKEILKEVYSR